MLDIGSFRLKSNKIYREIQNLFDFSTILKSDTIHNSMIDRLENTSFRDFVFLSFYFGGFCFSFYKSSRLDETVERFMHIWRVHLTFFSLSLFLNSVRLCNESKRMYEFTATNINIQICKYFHFCAFRANMQLNRCERRSKFQTYPIPFRWNKRILFLSTARFHKSNRHRPSEFEHIWKAFIVVLDIEGYDAVQVKMKPYRALQINRFIVISKLICLNNKIVLYSFNFQ